MEKLIAKLTLLVKPDAEVFDTLFRLKSKHRLAVAEAYNEGVKVGRKEIADQVLKQGAGMN